MALSTRRKTIKFSPLESELIELIPHKPERIDTNALIKRYYPKDPPLNARAIVVDRLRGIAEKAERGNMDWRLRKSKRAGPHPQQFWIESV